MVKLHSSEQGKLELDKLSTLTMAYTREGFEELKNDIRDKGQLVPILLRDGKVIDGRHRYRACRELCIDVAYSELGLISDQEALDIIISNSLNKSTSTDAAKVEAYLMCKAKGVNNVDMSKVFSRLNINYVRKISFIEKANPEYLRVILNQNSVRLYNCEFDKTENYGTINGLWRTLKGNMKFADTVVEVVPEPVSSCEYRTDLESYFDNAAAEGEYWEVFEVAKVSGTDMHPDSALGKKIASIIKSKYQ